MALTLTVPPKVTPRAFERLAEINEGADAPKALRVAVEGGGCSGFQYEIKLDDPADVAVLVTLAQSGGKDAGIHANFMGPIILNTAKRIGLQKHLNQVSGSVVIRAE